MPDRPGLVKRLYDEVTDKVSRKHPWYRLPKIAGLAELIGIRDTLRQQNLFDTSRLPSVDPTGPPPYDESYLAARTADDTWPDQDRMMTPNPREISRRLMTRDRYNTMRSVLARHCPNLEPAVAKLPNAFGIWDRTEGERKPGQ